MTSVTVRRGGAADALGAAAVLAVAAVAAGLAPVVGVVRAADGSAVWSAPGAVWVGLAPALLAAVLAARRPAAALAVAAGAGLVGLTRLLADLPVVLSPDSVARPDLFVETTDRALPLHAAAGGALLLVADAVAVAAGVFAAMRLARRLSVTSESDGPDGAARPDTVDELAAYQTARESAADRAGAPRNHLLTVAGFAGVLLLAVGALGVPYRGGYLAARYLAVGVPLLGMVAAVVLAVLSATAVLVGGSLPRGLAVALLGGVAVGAGVPYLAAIVSSVSGRVQLTSTVAIGIAGGVLLAAAGLLARARMVAAPAADRIAAPSRFADVAAGACGIGAAGLCVAAFLLPQLDAGGLEDLLVLSDGSPMPGTTLFGAAVIPLAVAGVLAAIRPTARAGRAALMVVWAAAVPAVTAALQTLGDDGISTARLTGLVRIGSGTWLGIGGLVLAVAAAAIAAVTARRVANAATTVADDETASQQRSVTVPIAVALGVLTVVAAALPVYGTSGQVQGPSVLRGYDLAAWGVWAGVVATVGALAGATLTRHRTAAIALTLAAAAVQAVRLVVPAAVPGAAGFGTRPGLVVAAVLVAGLIAGGVVLARAAGRIREVDLAGPVVAPARGGASSRGSRRRTR